jgi:hypothetical protein
VLVCVHACERKRGGEGERERKERNGGRTWEREREREMGRERERERERERRRAWVHDLTLGLQLYYIAIITRKLLSFRASFVRLLSTALKTYITYIIYITITLFL